MFSENREQGGRSYQRKVMQPFDKELCEMAAEQREVGDCVLFVCVFFFFSLLVFVF